MNGMYVEDADIWRKCTYCGEPILKGKHYRLHEGDVVCPKCYQDYALDLFLEISSVEIAGKE